MFCRLMRSDHSRPGGRARDGGVRGGHGARDLGGARRAGEPLLVLLHGMGANASVWERCSRSSSAPGRAGGSRRISGATAARCGRAPTASAPTRPTWPRSSRRRRRARSPWSATRSGGRGRPWWPAGGSGHGWATSRRSGSRSRGARPRSRRRASWPRRPAPVFATRDEADRALLRLSGLAGLAAPSSATAAAGVTGAAGRSRWPWTRAPGARWGRRRRPAPPRRGAAAPGRGRARPDGQPGADAAHRSRRADLRRRRAQCALGGARAVWEFIAGGDR